MHKSVLNKCVKSSNSKALVIVCSKCWSRIWMLVNLLCSLFMASSTIRPFRESIVCAPLLYGKANSHLGFIFDDRSFFNNLATKNDARYRCRHVVLQSSKKSTWLFFSNHAHIVPVKIYSRKRDVPTPPHADFADFQILHSTPFCLCLWSNLILRLSLGKLHNLINGRWLMVLLSHMIRELTRKRLRQSQLYWQTILL